MSRYSLDDLREYIRPSIWRPDGIDWQRSEQTVNSRLPSDYEGFMRTFGPGSIAGFFYIEPPIAFESHSVQGMSVPSEELLTDMESPYPAFPEPGGLIYLGGDSDADVVFYRAVGEPDDWPIVVRRRHHGFRESGWTQYDCGLVDFLMRMFHREFETDPLGGNPLWGSSPDDVAFQSAL